MRPIWPTAAAACRHSMPRPPPGRRAAPRRPRRRRSVTTTNCRPRATSVGDLGGERPHARAARGPPSPASTLLPTFTTTRRTRAQRARALCARWSSSASGSAARRLRRRRGRALGARTAAAIAARARACLRRSRRETACSVDAARGEARRAPRAAARASRPGRACSRRRSAASRRASGLASASSRLIASKSSSGIAPRRARDVEQVDEHRRAREVAEEARAEPVPGVRPRDQPGDVGEDEARLLVDAHDAEVRHERRERIVGDARAAPRTPRG